MYTKTCRQAHPGAVSRVAPAATALCAVRDSAGRTIVPCADDPSLSSNENAPDTPLHAIRPLGRQGSQGHEVYVPARPEPVRVRKVQLAEGSVQMRKGRGCVEQPDSGPADERLEARVGIIEMCV